jgi:heat shock protein HslJ
MSANISHTKFIQLMGLAFLLSIFLVACGGQQAEQPITGIDWQWVEISNTEFASQHFIPNPEEFTLRFFGDGTLGLQALGNMVSGTYTLHGNKMNIELIPTGAFWGEQDDLDLRLFGFLSNVNSYSLKNGRLLLDLAKNGGQIIFGESYIK